MSAETPGMEARTGLPWGMFALWAALLIAAALVAALALQVQQLRKDQLWLVKRTTQPYVGMYVPRVPLRALDGNWHIAGQPKARRQVLYFFTTSCPYCRNSAQMVNTLARALATLPDGEVELLGVAYAQSQEARAYARAQGFDFPVAATQDRRTSMLFRARRVPQLMVIGRDGRVRYSRLGVFNSKDGFNSVLSAVRGKDLPGAEPTKEAAP